MTYDSLYGFRERAHQDLGRVHDATSHEATEVDATHGRSVQRQA